MRALTELKKECMGRIIPDEYSICCYICYESRPKRLTIHHHCYGPQSVTYNQFENSDDGRLKYYAHLMDEIKNNINNFAVLCINCHNKLERLLKKYYDKNIRTTFLPDDYRFGIIYNATIIRREKSPQATTGLDEFWN